jgi:capsular polysaccharide biosynthesis protein/Mrp family chromosome partitioning ATPase
MADRMATAQEPARTLADYLAIVRRSLALSVAIVLATVGAAAFYTFRQPTLYEATMKIVVGQRGGIFQPGLGDVANQFTQTMSDLLESQVVAGGAIQQLHLSITPQELLSQLSVHTKPSSTVIDVFYDDTDASRGVQTLGAVGDVFSSLVDERLSRGNASLAVSATVFNPAHALPGKVQPKPIRNLAVATILGILLGLLVAVAREQIDDTIRSVDRAEAAFGQTATATVPPAMVGIQLFDRAATRKRDPILTELALQRLRASILFSPDRQEARTLLVTSASPEEGKTTIAASLAILLAYEGHNVIAVDGDLRRPTLHRYLGMPAPTRPAALDALLSGTVSIRQALVDVPVPTKTFATTGDPGAVSIRSEPISPGRLRAVLSPSSRRRMPEHGLARTIEVIDELKSLADFVIFDSPPILVVPDAYSLAATVDVVVAIVRNGRTSAKAASAMSRTLDRLRSRRVELVITDAEPVYGGAYQYGHRPEGEGQRRGGNGFVGVGGDRRRMGGNGASRVREQEPADRSPQDRPTPR